MTIREADEMDPIAPIDFTPITYTPADLDFAAAVEHERGRLLAMFGLPPSRPDGPIAVAASSLDASRRMLAAMLERAGFPGRSPGRAGRTP